LKAVTCYNVKFADCVNKPYEQSADKCAIPIVHDTEVTFIYGAYLSWSQGDKYLDFAGAEQNQGTHNGKEALGTPMVYSTNDTEALEYQPYNRYGDAYWMVELLVACNETENGWFELKGYFAPSSIWEPDIKQEECSGDIGGKVPFTSKNHIAKCGAVNVFEWASGKCIIDTV
ncbi:hypothetical protein COOONC_10775, partial [Cooperia oncophora]